MQGTASSCREVPLLGLLLLCTLALCTSPCTIGELPQVQLFWEEELGQIQLHWETELDPVGKIGGKGTREGGGEVCGGIVQDRKCM